MFMSLFHGWTSHLIFKAVFSYRKGTWTHHPNTFDLHLTFYVLLKTEIYIFPWITGSIFNSLSPSGWAGAQFDWQENEAIGNMLCERRFISTLKGTQSFIIKCWGCSIIDDQQWTLPCDRAWDKIQRESEKQRIEERTEAARQPSRWLKLITWKDFF